MCKGIWPSIDYRTHSPLFSNAAYLFHDLRGHPAGRAHKGVAGFGPGEVAPRRQPGGDTKVCYLNLAVGSQQDVSSLKCSSG